MHNDSIETLLSRHYGSIASMPAGLEQRLQASIRQQCIATPRQVTRRRAVHLVALGSAGLGILSLGLESLQLLEAGLLGQELTQQAVP